MKLTFIEKNVNRFGAKLLKFPFLPKIKSSKQKLRTFYFSRVFTD